MKIFYCWQSDTPNRIGKAFIRKTLDDAVASFSETMELDEAERPIVDQDTQGVMGSPPIAETILKKIRNSEVVVVDVTLVGKTPGGKKLLNSNVAYELGFAHGLHGDSVLLMLLNSYYGDPESLPFDLRHRRQPLLFDLSPDAPKDERQVKSATLANELKSILKEYIKQPPPGRKYKPTPSTENPATYWQDDEKIAPEIKRVHCELGYTKRQPMTFLRIWPEEPLEELTNSELSSADLEILPLLEHWGYGRSSGRNRYGFITFSITSNKELFSSTQVFKNREIWGVESLILANQSLPIKEFECRLKKSLASYLDKAFNLLRYRDKVQIEAGLVNVKDYRLILNDSYRNWNENLLENIVQTKACITKSDPDSKTKALLRIFEAVFNAAGLDRPKGLYGFPSAQG